MSSDLITSDGQAAFGLYNGEIKDINMDAYRHAGIPHWLLPFRCKRWRFVGLFSREVVVGAAVVDVGYVGTTFVYAFDMKSGRMLEFRAQSIGARHVSISDHSIDGRAAYQKGRNRVIIDYGPTTNLDVDVALPDGGRLSVKATIDESREAAIPHQIVTPTPADRFSFTHKSAGLPATGQIQTPDGSYTLSEGQAFAGVDHTAGVQDYHWEWRWSSLGGLATDGTRVGLNLVEPIHHPTFQENALWIGGERICLGAASFTYDPADILKEWMISTADGLVSLRFTPLGERRETLNTGLIVSRFHQPVGFYNGELRHPDGQVFTLENVPGVAEDHEARW